MSKKNIYATISEQSDLWLTSNLEGWIVSHEINHLATGHAYVIRTTEVAKDAKSIFLDELVSGEEYRFEIRDLLHNHEFTELRLESSQSSVTGYLEMFFSEMDNNLNGRITAHFCYLMEPNAPISLNKLLTRIISHHFEKGTTWLDTSYEGVKRQEHPKLLSNMIEIVRMEECKVTVYLHVLGQDNADLILKKD